jgi:hypothetical protein
MMTAKVPAKAFAVLYTWHGEKTKAIFLTKDRALDYIGKHSLGDAELKPMYYEDDFEGGVGCIARPSGVVLESVEKDGKLECVSASSALTVLPEK